MPWLNYVVQYKPSIKLLKEFTPCQQQGWSPALQLQKERKSRMPNLLYFCPESNCSQVFDTQEELERHFLKGDHAVVKLKTLLEYVQQSFVNYMSSCLSTKNQVLEAPSVSSTLLSDLVLQSMCIWSKDGHFRSRRTSATPKGRNPCFCR